MLNLGVSGLIISFLGLMVMLVSLHLRSHWSPIIKAGMTIAAVLLCAVTYSSYPALLGWPAQEKVLPSRLFLLGIQINEPHKIYLWGRDLDGGTDAARPRAYEIPYTVKTHESGEKAGNKMRRGLSIIMQRKELEGPRVITNESTDIDQAELIEFLEAPEGLLPSKQ